ncbi:hypothetical protein JTE90_004933 [Oedothorax gibbosus]|uniref:Allatotropin n=1 Tax=Oedothorax gibbosus TaxID=931172 RepID=A0AAV6TVU3_9ARAC|nr:hypothetical protein JTE90_004933 [Oedothorax gibbosus]
MGKTLRIEKTALTISSDLSLKIKGCPCVMSRLLLMSVFVVAVVCVHSSSSSTSQIRQKRGFRNAALSTARGFGKRTQQDTLLEEALARPVASSWLAEQMVRNPVLARVFVDKMVDQNGDGMIQPEEMYPTV